MAQTRVLTAVDPATGARITRRTARTYVAVVVIGDPAQGEAQAATWCGRPDLAEKALRKFSRPDARLAPVVEDPWAEAEAAPVVAEPEAVDRLGFATFNPETESISEALPPDCYPPATRRPVLPGEPEPVAARVAEPAPVTLPGEDRAAVAALRADAAAGRRVSLASLARALSGDLAEPAPTPDSLRARAAVRLAEGERVAEAEPDRAHAAHAHGRLMVQWADSLSPAPTGSAWEGQPWDPGTPDARARVALQGERVATLWPIAQAVRGAGFDLPPAWWPDGPVMAGERPYGEALAALPLGAIAAAAAALAALPPVTAAQGRALRLCRGEAVGV